MKKIYKAVITTMIMTSVFTTGIFADESISSKEYYSTLKEYIRNEEFNSVPKTKIVNIKGVMHGMNLGYIKPRIELIEDKKDYIREMITEFENIQVDNDEIQELNGQIVSRLKDMHSGLDASLKRHIEVLNYNDSYMDKSVYLIIGGIFSDDGSSNTNLENYKTNRKEIKRILKDIKRLS